jgi:hypothetical protein
MKKASALALAIAVAIGALFVPASATAQNADVLLDVLPDGSGAIILDVRKITTSELWTWLSAQGSLKKAIDQIQSELAKFGLNLGDIQVVATSMPTSSKDKPTVAVSGTFNPDNLVAHLPKLKAEKYKGVDLYSLQQDQQKPPVSFAFLNPSLIVIGSTDGVRASIEVKEGERASLAKNEKLRSALAQNPVAAIRFALANVSSLPDPLHSSNVPLPDFSSIRLIFGAIDVTSGIDLNLTLQNDTAEHAKAIANQLNGLLAMGKGLLGSSNDPKLAPIAEALKTISITGSNLEVKITGNLTKEFFTRFLR